MLAPAMFFGAIYASIGGLAARNLTTSTPSDNVPKDCSYRSKCVSRWKTQNKNTGPGRGENNGCGKGKINRSNDK